MVPARRRLAFWVVVILTALLGVGAGVLWASRQDKGWEATGTVFVAFTFPAEEKDPFGASQFVTQRIDTYAQLGKSPDVLQAVANDVGAVSMSQLADVVEVTTDPGTVLIRVTAVDTDRSRATRIAESVMTNLNRAAIAVEAGNKWGVSPISLVPVQPPVAVPAPLLMTAVMAGAAGLAGGAALGAVLGWLLCRAMPQRRPEPARPPQHGRHRGGANRGQIALPVNGHRTAQPAAHRDRGGVSGVGNG